MHRIDPSKPLGQKVPIIKTTSQIVAPVNMAEDKSTKYKEYIYTKISFEHIPGVVVEVDLTHIH